MGKNNFSAPLRDTRWSAGLRQEYHDLWQSCQITAPARIEAVCRSIRNARSLYQSIVEEVTKQSGGVIPWYFVAVIHQLESSGNFNKHLHNGDSLKRRTTHEPKYRPIAPPQNGAQYTFRESAIDALTMPGKAFHKEQDWSIERQLYLLERFNGFGYRLYRGIQSPYLWAGSNHYTRGKYVADGKWDANAVSKQSGAGAVLKQLEVIK